MAHSVLITGGSSGIGRALVEWFAREDFQVSFTYRTGEARARDLIASLPDRRVQAFHFDQGERRTLLAQLPRHPDIAIFNAGLGSQTVAAYAAEARADEDEALIRVNATGGPPLDAHRAARADASQKTPPHIHGRCRSRRRAIVRARQ